MIAAATLTGARVRLTALDFDKDMATLTAWSQDSEFLRLLQTNLARPWTPAEMRRWQTEAQGAEFGDDQAYLFGIRTLAADRLIGTIDLSIPDWPHREAWLGIGLGARADWGQGYGREAMQLLLRYAFVDLNLFRVTLSVFSYNPRAVHVYEQLGFVHEGAQRDRLRRDGQRYAMLYMGLLRSEWLARQTAEPESQPA